MTDAEAKLVSACLVEYAAYNRAVRRELGGGHSYAQVECLPASVAEACAAVIEERLNPELKAKVAALETEWASVQERLAQARAELYGLEEK